MNLYFGLSRKPLFRMQPHQVRTQTFFIFAASFSHNFHVISIHVRGRVTVLLIKHYLLMWLLIIKKREKSVPHSSGISTCNPVCCQALSELPFSAFPPSLMGHPLAGSELRGAFISDPQVRPRCLSCQNSPIQHCAEFINAPLTQSHTHAHTHTDMRACLHRCTLQKMSSANCSSVRLVGIGLFSQ